MKRIVFSLLVVVGAFALPGCQKEQATVVAGKDAREVIRDHQARDQGAVVVQEAFETTA